MGRPFRGGDVGAEAQSCKEPEAEGEQQAGGPGGGNVPRMSSGLFQDGLRQRGPGETGEESRQWSRLCGASPVPF